MLSETETKIALNSSAEWVDAPLSRSAAPSDAARFSDLLGTAGAQISASPPLAVAPVHQPSGNHLGDVILDSLQRAGHQYKAVDAHVGNALLDMGQLSLVELVRMHHHHVNASMLVDFVGKGVSKATQQLDQLVKLQ